MFFETGSSDLIKHLTFKIALKRDYFLPADFESVEVKSYFSFACCLIHNEIDSASVIKEMIDVRDGSVKCELFNIDKVEFIINDLCIN